MADGGGLSGVVTGSVVDKEVSTINDGIDMIRFLSQIDIKHS